MQEREEMWTQSLGGEDLLEKGMASHSSIPAWRIPWTEEPDGLWFIGSQRVGQDWSDLAHAHTNVREVIVLSATVSVKFEVQHEAYT